MSLTLRWLAKNEPAVVRDLQVHVAPEIALSRPSSPAPRRRLRRTSWATRQGAGEQLIAAAGRRGLRGSNRRCARLAVGAPGQGFAL